MEKARSNFFDTQVLGHPAGLFVLFFTEMWERFSFYGMRVLLINFLTMAMIGYNPGWQWTTENAGALFGTYVMLLYLTPIVGGIIADRFTGYRWAIVIGAVIMTLGHAAMAVETEFWLYVGLGLLVVGTGFFKPNMTSIISHMYKDLPEKKDGAYTIFYMGVNAGAFFGMMLCGYIAEKVGWSWGFGLAGVFMLLGTLQFWLARPLFGTVGDVPSKARKEVSEKQYVNKEIKDLEKRNPFTMLDKVLIAIAAIIGLGYAINDPLSRIGGIDLFKFLETQNIKGQYIAVVFGLFVFLFVVISRISRYTKIVRNRMITVIIFAFFTVFFWLSFEQGASSLIIFARDNVQRELLGSQAVIFNVVNALLTVIPLLLITYVLYLLGKKTFSKIFASNIVLLVCFGLVWVVVGWMLKRDFNTVAYSVSYDAFQVYDSDGKDLKINSEGDFVMKQIPLAIDDTKLASEVHITTKTQKMFKITEVDVSGKAITKYVPFTDKNTPKGKYEIVEKAIPTIAVPRVNPETGAIVTDKKGEKLYDFYATENNTYSLVSKETIIGETDARFEMGQDIFMLPRNNDFSSFGYVDAEKMEWAKERAASLHANSGVVKAVVREEKSNWVEITTSWFSILNSFFIIALANLFSRWWDSRYNPPAAVKYGLGLIIMAIGFGLLALGAHGVTEGVKVSMIWLVLAYLFHTMGELCMSPVGLSYVSKLVPARMIAFMFGVWYLAIAIGNKVAAILGGQIENITNQYSLSTFFLIFTIVPVVAGLLIISLNPLIKKLMHGVK